MQVVPQFENRRAVDDGDDDDDDTDADEKDHQLDVTPPTRSIDCYNNYSSSSRS